MQVQQNQKCADGSENSKASYQFRVPFFLTLTSSRQQSYYLPLLETGIAVLEVQ
jgi:hypothetical protein